MRRSFPPSFGELVAHGRRQRGLSQEALADDFSRQRPSLSPEELNELEQDRQDPRSVPGLISRFAELLGLDETVLCAAANDFEDTRLRRRIEDRQMASSLAAFRRIRE